MRKCCFQFDTGAKWGRLAACGGLVGRLPRSYAGFSGLGGELRSPKSGTGSPAQAASLPHLL